MLKKWTAKDIQLKISKQKEKKKEKFINRETAETARKKESYEEKQKTRGLKKVTRITKIANINLLSLQPKANLKNLKFKSVTTLIGGDVFSHTVVAYKILQIFVQFVS